MQWPLLGYRHNYNIFRNNRLVLTNIASNLRFILDKNAFVMIIIPVENKLIQFDSPCNLLNLLLSAMFIFICFSGYSFCSCFVLFNFLLHVWLSSCMWLISLHWSWPAERPGSDDGGIVVNVAEMCLFCFAVHTSVHLQFFFTFLRACWDRTALTWNQKLMIG